MLFANKKFVGEAIKSEADGTLLTQSGEFSVKEGDIIFRPFSGEAEVLTENWFNEHYVPVEKVKKKKRPSKSPFEDEYTKALIEFSQMKLKNEEGELYIQGTKEIHNL